MSGIIKNIKKNLGVSTTELDGKPLDHWKTSDSFVEVRNPETNETIQIQPKDGVKFWKEHLSKEEYKVLREKGTERPHTSSLNYHYPKSGYYACRGCGNPLYSYKAKFDSGCGWPAFGSFIEGSVETRPDNSLGMERIEILCNRCKGHLGHVFKERHGVHTERHCVNGVSIKYVDEPLPASAREQCKALK